MGRGESLTNMLLMGKRLAALAMIVLVAGCSAVPAMAPLDEGDIVGSGVGSEPAENLARFDAFLAVTQTGGEDAVRIVQRTSAGYPIYIDIMYADGKYTVIRDTTEDEAASEKNRKRELEAACEELVQVERLDHYLMYSCGEFRFLIENWEK